MLISLDALQQASEIIWNYVESRKKQLYAVRCSVVPLCHFLLYMGRNMPQYIINEKKFNETLPLMALRQLS